MMADETAGDATAASPAGAMATALETLRALIGTSLGTSGWLAIEQERVDRFAVATGDSQYIHIDPVSAAETPFGGTIAHGFLTLSLLPALLGDLDGPAVVPGARMTINYGLNRVRFITPVRVGARVRLRAELLAVEAIGEGAVQLTERCTIEIEGEARPACVAEIVLRQIF